MSEYNIFNDRYVVIIGERGKVSVISKIQSQDNTRPMKTYGKVKDKTGYVNLTKEKGGCAAAYLLHEIKDYVTGLTEELSTFDPCTLYEETDLNSYILPVSEVYNLPCTIDPLKGYRSYEQSLDDNRSITYNEFIDYRNSDGLIYGQFNISLTDYSREFTTYSQSERFIIPDKFNIKDLNTLWTADLKEIIKRLQIELDSRQ